VAKNRRLWADLQRELARHQRQQQQALRMEAQVAARARRDYEQAARAAARQATVDGKERKRLYTEARKAEAGSMAAELRDAVRASGSSPEVLDQLPRPGGVIIAGQASRSGGVLVAGWGIRGWAAWGVVRSATMVTGWPQCGQSRVAAGCGLAGAGAGVAGAVVRAWGVRRPPRRSQAVPQHLREQ
jgi:hypothetical protein